MPIPTTDQLVSIFKNDSDGTTAKIQSFVEEELDSPSGLDSDDLEEFNQYKKVFTWDTEYIVSASYVLHELDVSQVFESADEYQECLEGNSHNRFDEWGSDDVDLHEGTVEYRQGEIDVSGVQLRPEFRDPKPVTNKDMLKSNATDLKSEILAFEVVLAEKKKEYFSAINTLELKEQQLDELLKQSPSD
tara:strand:- start:378 stop:944 length:567 start_codon:yes stop_codon:yes gene_type:complete